MLAWLESAPACRDVHGRTQWSAPGWEGEVGSCTKQGFVDMSPIGQTGEPQ